MVIGWFFHEEMMVFWSGGGVEGCAVMKGCCDVEVLLWWWLDLASPGFG
jgi:hypothetical protein